MRNESPSDFGDTSRFPQATLSVHSSSHAGRLAGLRFFPPLGAVLAWTLRQRHAWRNSSRANELEVTRRLLEESEASKAEMAQCLHEPVRAMKALLENMDLARGEDSVARQLGELIANVDAVTAKIADIRDLARLKSGTYAVSVSSVDLGALLRDCEQAFQPAAERAGLDLVVSPVSAWVRSDAVMLQRIIGNLMHNAIRFTCTGAVAISCKVSGDEVRLTVRDTGVGMYPHQLGGLLCSREQAAPDGAGSQAAGLGLEVVRRMAGLLGHKLSAQSAKGKGSDFTITLARVRPQAAAGFHDLR